VLSNCHSIEYVEVSAIKLRDRRWRINPARQIDEAARQLQRTGKVVEPPLLDGDDYVVCGGAIVQAAQKLKWTTIPILRVGNMSPEQLRLYAINARKLSDMGSYDDALLAEELRELEKLLGEQALATLAMDEGELTRLLGLGERTGQEASELLVIDDSAAVITEPGDLWQIGENHRLLCASSLEASSFVTLMDGKRAQFGLADPPYNISMRTISSNPDREEFAFAHGEMTPNEFTRFLTKVMREMKLVSDEGSLHAFFMSYHYLLELLRAGTMVFGRPKAMCTWVKSQAGQGSLFRSQTEQIVYFQNGTGPYRNNVQLGKHGRNRSTAWHYDGMTTASSERAELLKEHATPKPTDLLKDAILDVTTRRGIVLDPFGGIGSTMVAAEAAERCAYLIEIEPRYVDVTIRRMRKAYGLEAIRLRDGRTFSDTEKQAEANDEVRI
jgi:DNA methylase